MTIEIRAQYDFDIFAFRSSRVVDSLADAGQLLVQLSIPFHHIVSLIRVICCEHEHSSSRGFVCRCYNIVRRYRT